ncbi:MAG: hypothetical protein WBQ23_03900 [Bacteroidota bacterium]
MKAALSLIMLAALLLGYFEARAQDNVLDSPTGGGYAIVATLAGGYARYIMPYDAGIDIDRDGAVVSARLLWYSDHRLRMGLESGWTRFYSYQLTDVETSFGRTDASLSLSAIPVLAVFSMAVGSAVVLYGGAGGYFVRSHATSFGTTVDVTRFSQGWMAAVSYDYTVAAALRIGAELKWYGATEFGDGVVTMQLRVPIVLMTW